MRRFTLLLFAALLLACAAFTLRALEPARTWTPKTRPRKLVLIAGPITGHDKHTHEYEKSVTLLKQLLDTSPNLEGITTEAHYNGWPQDERTLDDADAIVLISDGGDHNETDHPLYVGNRFATLERQMRRGAGFACIHWSVFHPSRVHDRITEWMGGYFDYERGDTPNAPNKWYSRIQTWEATANPAAPAHPILRGVRPFTMPEEFYYRLRFRDSDPRLTRLLSTRPPNEPQDYPVAWAVERMDGGRGFGTSGGHFYKNWWKPDWRKFILNALVWTAGAEVPRGGVESRLDPPKRALIVTGHHHPGHDWRKLTSALLLSLEQDPRFVVDVVEDPEAMAGLGPSAAFASRLTQKPEQRTGRSGPDLVVLNYNNWERPGLSEAAKNGLRDYLKAGGGLALVHFANGAFNYTLPAKDSDWPEYRTKIVARAWMHDSDSGHDPYGPFRVSVADAKHPITAGLAPFDTTDELYFNQKGDLRVTPLVTAHSKVTGRDEPLALAYNYGRGRIFQTLLGHSDESVRHAGALIRRGAAWAANLPPLTSDPPTTLMENALFRNGSEWTVDKSLQRANFPQAAAGEGQNAEVPGRFGNALNAAGGALVSGSPVYRTPPISLEIWAKLDSKGNFNILAACEPKSSATHWELFTEAGTGRLAAYFPGATPDHARTSLDIADSKWHYLMMVLTKGGVKLYVDGKLAANQPMQFRSGPSVEGPLAFGRLAEGGLSCDGLLDEIRISSVAYDARPVPVAPLPVEDAVLGLWRFDRLADGQFADSGRRNSPARLPGASSIVRTAYEQITTAPPPLYNRGKGTEWPTVNNDKGGTRWSSLKQINRDNVSQLDVAWRYKSGDASQGSTIECTPLMVEGILYLTTPGLKLVALDATTGREIWKFDPKAGGVNRGVAYWSDGKADGARRILYATPDGRMFSLDAKTGRVDRSFGEAGVLELRKGVKRDISKLGYGVTSAPMVFENLVFLGFVNSEGQPGAPGDVRAFDVRTGKEVWTFHTVPEPGEYGNETWENGGWKERSGVNPWSGFTLDEKNGILFCATGSAASDFYGADRLGTNLFANCILALDARTGKRLWHFQTVHHDMWDWDNPTPPLVVTVNQNGRKVDAVAQPTKTGFLFLLDRKTGKPLFDVNEVPVPPSDVPGERASPTQPEPVKPPRLSPGLFRGPEDVTDRTPEAREKVLERLKTLKYGQAYLPPSVQGTVVSPGFHGGANWSGASFDPTTGRLFINTNNVPYICQLKANGAGGYDFMGYTYFNDHEGYPANKGPWGFLTAVDLNRGEFVWRNVFGTYPEMIAKGLPPTGTENFGGSIVTAGGLVFIGGTKDEKFHAYDKDSGKLLWETALPAGGYATPCTYRVNGRQYVVIAAGGGGKLRTKSGDEYIAFALPEATARR